MLLCLVLAASARCERTESIEVSLRRFPADGQSGGVLRYDPGSGNGSLFGPEGDTEAIHLIRREADDRGERVFFRSTFRPGRVQFRGRDARVELEFVASLADADEDGFPDSAELATEEDRRAFRAWFVRVSQSQYMKLSPAWQDEQRDCAGLIRFAYQEALKTHDDAWQRRSGVLLDKNLPDVKRFRYPAVPLLGGRLFRIAEGELPASEKELPGYVERHFAPFARAEFLKQYNTRWVGRDLALALPGDVLFFRDDRRAEDSFHSMIVTEPREHRERTVVIYHTGGPAGLKRVPVAYLLALPDGRFRPVPENAFFLGVHRFLILD